MNNKRTWAARAVVLGMTATMFVGAGVAGAGSASAAGSSCNPPGPHRPDGPVTTLLEPLLGQPGAPKTPLGDSVFSLTDLLDRVLCPLLP